jgi:ribA/ribD-fused uncharacterized protein
MTPPLDVDELRARVAGGARFAYRHFWGHRARPDGVLTDSVYSQWWPCRFEVDGQAFSSAEQFMMAGKARLFGDEETRAKILAVPDPGKVKALGRQVRGFDEAPWAAARFDLVTRGNLAKFGDDARLRAHLLASGDDVLVEASPLDAIWGIGLAADSPLAGDPAGWRGLNLLGFALVRTRAILRGDLPPL